MIMRHIFFIIVMSVVVLYAEFSRDKEGMVFDSRTNLLWQDSYRDNGDKIKQTTWQDALIYCEELTLGGNSDWRVPNIVELKSIKDVGRVKPAISAIFKITRPSYYWASTTPSSSTSNAWGVDFYNGHGHWNSKKTNGAVRCVRGGL